ncbi:hypothetical protein GTZ99_12250 [Novosphingobium sp. FSY-8]|uniref:Uncharacterized protein n=1 Tax=Novosphingobium ovatum TaxID=1908523 RepID=A0ABW9XFM6_9SPHN|nr:hypothetical protein [Novosphingobium ovatum]NBC37321.1 hypothetical protein [Novosphingobium ovatum]
MDWKKYLRADEKDRLSEIAALRLSLAAEARRIYDRCLKRSKREREKRRENDL